MKVFIALLVAIFLSGCPERSSDSVDTDAAGVEDASVEDGQTGSDVSPAIEDVTDAAPDAELGEG